MKKRLHVLFIPAGWMQAVDKPDPETLLRLEAGLLEWWRGWRDKRGYIHHQYDLVIVTGGLFRPEHVQTISAGQTMGRWLVGNGVPADRVIIEGHSLDTFQNVRFGMMALRQRVQQTPIHVTVVSHWQHALRIAVTFWRMYGMHVDMAPLWYLGSIKLFCTELAAFFVHVFDPDGTSKIARTNRRKRQMRTE